ncbi:solute carrier family 22 member 7-like [Synchiropus splendidus]|uniref:solute carrier family 22 member 7-like n=1 Tax=Synchiropus splendidus TaxID=270530 RepID=UPI00237DA74B|nr:solute carrier family 22 member 7-like [Synchiropus splendidus]
MKFEDIITEINGFGRFQKMIIVFSFIGRFTLPCHFLLNNFISAVPSHHCDLDDGGTLENLTLAQKLRVSIPVEDDGSLSSCQMFAEPQFHLLHNWSNSSQLSTVSCRRGWVYDNSTFKSTITSQNGNSVTMLTLQCEGQHFKWMPESACWLIANRKLEDAQTYLQRCGTMNGMENETKSLSIKTLSTDVVTVKKDQTYTYLDLIRTLKMRILVLQTGIVWFCVATAFYGISFNIRGFGLNIYLTHFTYAAVEIPGKVVVFFLLDRIGRRSTMVGSLLLVGICFGINILVQEDQSVVRTAVASIGKAFCSSSYATIPLYISELYPTVVRQNGMGYNSFMCRLGVVVAPLILLLDELWRDLPQLILMSVAILGAAVSQTVRETRDRCLPETIEDVEQH